MTMNRTAPALLTIFALALLGLGFWGWAAQAGGIFASAASTLLAWCF